jgi:host factor-I protein
MITRRLIRPSINRVGKDDATPPDNSSETAPARDERDARDEGGREGYDARPAPSYGYNREGGEGGYDRPQRDYDRPSYNDRPAYGNRPYQQRQSFRPGFKPGFRPMNKFNQGFNKKFTPSSDTNAENFYYKKQMEKKTPIVALLRDGEVIRGWIEWYDRDVLKINRDDGPNLLVFKANLKYIYKDEEKLAQLEAQRAAEAAAHPETAAGAAPADREDQD